MKSNLEKMERPDQKKDKEHSYDSFKNLVSSNGVANKTYANSGNEKVLNCIPALAKTILDIGCGAGDNASVLTKKGKTVDGITLSNDEANFARRYCRHVSVYNLESGIPREITGPYDAVICSHVLEHICFPKQLLSDIAKNLKSDGLLVVALPNLLWWKNRLKVVMGRIEYQDSGLMDNTHFRWYTYQSAQKLLCENGFEIVKAEADGPFPLGPIRRLLPNVISRNLDRLAAGCLPGLFGYQMLFVARRTT